MSGIKQFVSEKRGVLIASGIGIVIAVAAFFVGASSNDESGTVSDLEGDVATLESDKSGLETEVAYAEGEKEQAEEREEDAQDELATERGFKGAGEARQIADSSEFESDYPWGAVGEVDFLSIKPISLDQNGDTWTLTLEAKNEGSSPAEPFCGYGSSTLVDAEEREFSGETVLSYEGGGDNCGDSLQPGLTGTYVEEFELAPNAKPVLVYIAAEYGEEGQSWTAP